MSNAKTVNKGEFLFKEGDKVQSLVLVQSGALQLCITRPKKNIDLATIGAGQVLGELALIGGAYPYSALATTETKVLELPAELYKQQVDAAPQVLKVVIKSLTDRLKIALGEVRSARAEKDASPCPEDQVAKVFGSIYHTGHHKGEKDPKNPNVVEMEWQLFRQYSQRVFGESLKRLEQATHILVKLKLAQYVMGKSPDDPDGPDEIQRVRLLDLGAVESFFEFFQYYYFKGGKTDLLKSDDMATTFLTQFIKLGEPLEKDRFGVVTIEYAKVVESFKEELGVNLNKDHFARLEAKGVMMKRTLKPDNSAWLSYELKEYQTTAKVWRILREIEKWNEKGFVDPNEEEVKIKKKAGAPTCPQCAAEVAAQAKFCQDCGFKLEMAKAS